ncbi:flagellar export chaperone FliS [Clostridium folliculivorans]|uniref:Flagellar secretion chaperone FliS n=1 Tax=Clostridium folliculivorans TaxID=2886038 RepID=A0A9W5XYS9_9CLOT|nr:flagellar export chaperone FliS [Clostridium folliculivorans]GKU23559.1 flagellar protein FliS [Clostridium folliculivorans]GKU29675.1 flagellar protein FliS [Clostridium folliculivorans]
MYANNGYNVYKNNSVNYASKEQLLLMLLDGAVKYAKIGRQAIEDKDIKKAHENIKKTEDIFTELMVSLDTNAGDWAKSLFAVYEFINYQLMQANIKKDTSIMDTVIPMIEDIRNTWQEAEKLSKAAVR